MNLPAIPVRVALQTAAGCFRGLPDGPLTAGIQPVA